LARKPATWRYLIGIAIALFAADQLHEWYSIGQMYYRSIGGGTYVSYTEPPGKLIFVAIVYLSALLLFGGSLLYTLIGNLPRRGAKQGSTPIADM
jgi:hypothetical protein